MNRRLLGTVLFALGIVGCSGGTDVSGLWVVDLKSVEQSEEFKKTDDKMVREMLIATYRSMSLEIDGKVLTMSGLGEATRCTINNFDTDNGVTCENGKTTFGLYKKDDALIMKDGSSDEKSLRLIRSASKAKGAESTPPTKESANSKVTNFIGTWGGSGEGALGTCGKDPVVITQDGVAVGKEKFPVTFDATGDIPLAGGATALRSQDKDTLIYLNSDGLELDMKRCK